MYVIDEAGKVHSGTAISDEENVQREELVKLLHETVCGKPDGHRSYEAGTEKCVAAANLLVLNFKLAPRKVANVEDLVAKERERLAPNTVSLDVLA